MRLKLLALVALFTSLPAFADFEGILDMKMSSTATNGLMKIRVGKDGTRVTMEMGSGGKGRPQINITALNRFDSPDVAYLINDAQKSYAEVSVKQNAADPQTWTVKRIGDEKVASYAATHIVATSSKGVTQDMWLSADVGDFSTYEKAMRQAQSQTAPGLAKALADAKVKGFPVKSIHRMGADAKDAVTIELVKAEKKSLPASTFQIPPGYTKNSVADQAMSAMPPEVRAQMEAAMKQMTPAQREQMRKLMENPATAPPQHP